MTATVTSAATAKLGSELDRLFAAPLKTFVDERKRLAAELKASGRPKEATEVGKTPKPSVSAWVVNQLVRQQAPLLKSFVETTARLRGAQRPGARAGGADHTTEALAAHREALKGLRARAEEILTASGQAARPPILERVVRNLRVGMASEESRTRIESGRLIQDLAEEDFVSLLGEPSEAADAEADVGVAASPAPAVEPPSAETGKARELARRQAGARATEEAKTRARGEAESARARLEADRRIRALEVEADAARRTQDKEERAVEAARQTLAQSEDRLRRARLDSERAAQELASAEAALQHR
jgi:hypothetical protein